MVLLGKLELRGRSTSLVSWPPSESGERLGRNRVSRKLSWGPNFRFLWKLSAFHLYEPPLDYTMTWRMGPRFTMLLAMWLVCGSEPHPRATHRGSHGGRKGPLVSPVNGSRPGRFLRHTGRSHGTERATLGEPNLRPLQSRRSVPVLRLASPQRCQPPGRPRDP